MNVVAYAAHYWSSSPGPSFAYNSYSLLFNYDGNVDPSFNYYRSFGWSLRCVQE